MENKVKSYDSMRMQPNWVLLRPDPDYTTYQRNGVDSGILNSLHHTTVGERAGISGMIVKVPETLNCMNVEIALAKDRNYGGEEVVKTEVDRLRRQSVLFKVPMELAPGQKVLFNFKNQIDVYREGRVIRTEDGEMFMVKYDTINAIELGPDNLYPLNGLVFIEKVKMDEEVERKSGIVLLEQKHMGIKKKQPFALGRVIEAGCLVNAYLDFPGTADDRHPLSKGDYIFYDERMSKNLQFELHQTHKTHRTVISRKDIYGYVEDPKILNLK